MSAPPPLDEGEAGAASQPKPAADPHEAGLDLSSSARGAIVFAAGVGAVASALSTAFLPVLLARYPALLLVLSSDGRNVALAAARLDLWTVLAIAVPRRVVAMLLTWGVSLLYGRAALDWTSRRWPRLARLAAWLERMFLRFRYPLLVLWPAYVTAGLAGIARMPLRPLVPALIAGQTLFVIAWFFLGDALSGWTERAIQALSERLWESTALCAALVATQQLVSYLRRRRARRSG